MRPPPAIVSWPGFVWVPTRACLTLDSSTGDCRGRTKSNSLYFHLIFSPSPGAICCATPVQRLPRSSFCASRSWGWVEWELHWLGDAAAAATQTATVRVGVGSRWDGAIECAAATPSLLFNNIIQIFHSAIARVPFHCGGVIMRYQSTGFHLYFMIMPEQYNRVLSNHYINCCRLRAKILINARSRFIHSLNHWLDWSSFDGSHC